MEDSSVAMKTKTDTILPLGMSSFAAKDRQQFGQNIRIAMALFRAGKLSWSKIRLLVSVANADNEKTLCHAALDASVTEVKRLCSEYRWAEDETHDGENERAVKQWESRSLSWDEVSNGSTRIQLVLPPELAQAFLNSIEHSLSLIEVDDSEHTVSQRRADAAVLMAESNLQVAGRDIATADRYQVIVSVDSAELATPSKRATVKGAGPIARETARRIACDCSVTTVHKANGEPTDIGRRSRLWPAVMARAIKDRDRHCQFYGCTQTKNLQIHHIEHWADGGKTCVDNGACLCQYHHTMVHEGGYSIEAVAGSEQRLAQQFSAQRHEDDLGMFSVEADLRNDEVSFSKVRGLSPTRYRFCVLDSEGRDLSTRRVALDDEIHVHSTRIEWKLPNEALSER